MTIAPLVLAAVLVATASCGRTDAGDTSRLATSVLFVSSWGESLLFSVDAERTGEEDSCSGRLAFSMACQPLDENGQLHSTDDLCVGPWTFRQMYLWAADQTDCAAEAAVAICDDIVDHPLVVGQNLLSIPCETKDRGRINFDVTLDP